MNCKNLLAEVPESCFESTLFVRLAGGPRAFRSRRVASKELIENKGMHRLLIACALKRALFAMQTNCVMGIRVRAWAQVQKRKGLKRGEKRPYESLRSCVRAFKPANACKDVKRSHLMPVPILIAPPFYSPLWFLFFFFLTSILTISRILDWTDRK